MADRFDQFLEAALAPEERLPDRAFVARIQSAIALDQELAAERRVLVAGLVKQLAALVAVAAGLWVIGRAEPFADWFAASPALGLGVVLAAFVATVALFSGAVTRSESA